MVKSASSLAGGEASAIFACAQKEFCVHAKFYLDTEAPMVRIVISWFAPEHKFGDGRGAVR
jgi:hypothetical protein